MKPKSRIIHHGFFTNAKLIKLKFEVRLYFAGLWTIADKEGRLEYDPDQFKISLFPGDDVDIEVMTKQLESADFVYLDADRKYLQITNWKKHQKPHWNETESEIDEFQQVTLIESNKSLESPLKVSIIKSKSKIISKSKNSEIPFEEIIGHLNECAKTNYKHNSKKTQSLISARWNEGFRVVDFKYVHAVKVEEWMQTDMEKYLRPETLYSNKFEAYKNQKPKTITSDMPDWQRKNAEIMQRKLAEFNDK